MDVIVIGGGHAGVEACSALRDAGHRGLITLIDEQADLPYQRPPLSKDVLKGGADAATPLKHHSFYTDRDVDLITGTTVATIDRAARSIALSDGRTLHYGHLVLATGSDPIAHDAMVAGTTGIHLLRTMDDARALSDALGSGPDVVIVGAGFIGLEVAAAARLAGGRVTVVAHSPRVMSRSLSALMSEAVLARHIENGIEIMLDTTIVKTVPDDAGRVRELLTDRGRVLRADLVVVGVGVRPRTELAARAGLDVDDGIVVDGRLRTSDESISAIGDCARFPTRRGDSTRLECVQNATEQARHLAATLTGSADEYDAVPWFWSIQGSVRLQIAGVAGDDAAIATFGDPESGKFSVLRFDADGLRCVESMNDAGTHLAARKLLARRPPVTLAEAAGFSMDLRAVSRAVDVSA